MFPVLDIALIPTKSVFSTQNYQKLFWKEFPFWGQKGKGVFMCAEGLRSHLWHYSSVSYT